MFETYRMLGREREAELESEAARLRPLAGRPLVPIWAVVLVVSVALVATLASAARAEVWPGGRVGAQLPTKAASNLVDRTITAHKRQVLAPDDRVRTRIVETSYPDFVDRFVARRKALAQLTPSGSRQVSEERFDWAAAGVGASSIAALLLVLGAGIGAARRFRTGSAGA